MSYTQISKEERLKLESYLEAGLTQECAAGKLGRSKGTISREIRRNGNLVTGRYDARAAHTRSKRRHYVKYPFFKHLVPPFFPRLID